MSNRETFWLTVLAVICMVVLTFLSITQALDMPQVHKNPDGTCVAVLYPKKDGRVGKGDCGMLPTKYETVHVPFSKEYRF